MIAVHELTKRFDGRIVLDAVSLRFERGKVTSIVGPSGCGKSTLLRCINGLERFDAGSIEVGEHRIAPLGGRAAERATRAVLSRVRLEVGMVFQHYGLFAHMTALENVMEAPVHVKHVPAADARQRAEELLEKVGLTRRRDAFPREMSGGEQQRVAIARALAMDPKALLLDEPTSALDPERKAEVVGVIERLAKEGTTMIIVTHEPAVVKGIADLVVTMKDGKADA
ncbi:MAG: amino acid ABC transporter ATP-binding protein [Deltaproteobacteria bacterium]|nr:amino acid ABC transporter ATP-binding protein [Deltaproteobacteria bacterium]